MSFRKLFVLLFTLLSLCCTAFAQEEYRIHNGDSLDIKVIGYEEFSNASDKIINTKELNSGYKVRSDGKITFPLLGDVYAKGNTPEELAQRLTEQLKEYLINPEVYVAVLSEGTTRVYLLGEIKHPGLYELKKSRTVLDAISAGGSWTDKTAKKRIYLIRKGNEEKPIKINLKKMLKTGNMEQNYELNEGDVLYFKDNGKLF